MSSTDKEQLQKVKEFLKNNPYEARRLISENPELFDTLLGNQNNQGNENTQSNSETMGGNSLGGQQLVKHAQGSKIPMMFDWGDKGFSSYIMLAVLAFVIQFAITLICIFFYK